MLNNSIIEISNLEILPPLFSTVEASGVTLTGYIVEILNKLLHLSVLLFPHQGKWGNSNSSYHSD